MHAHMWFPTGTTLSSCGPHTHRSQSDPALLKGICGLRSKALLGPGQVPALPHGHRGWLDLKLSGAWLLPGIVSASLSPDLEERQVLYGGEGAKGKTGEDHWVSEGNEREVEVGIVHEWLPEV